MNEQGLAVILSGVSARLHMAFYEDLVTKHHIKQDELDGTRKMAASVVATLKKTPHDKIESLVAKFDAQLTKHNATFNQKDADPLGALHEAQTMLGLISTIFAKAGIRE